MNPKVSIMIPVYNSEKYIRNTIESALRQDYGNLEIVVCDDCSTDNTQKVLQSFDYNPILKVHYNEKNLGRVMNYNHLLNHLVFGDYVLNLDGDDELVNDSFISECMNTLNRLEEPKPNLVMGCQQSLINNKIIKEQHIIETNCNVITGTDYVINVLGKYKFSHLAALYNRKLAISMNFYSLDVISSDMHSLLRLALKGNVLLVNNIAGQWNSTDSNESTDFDFSKTLHNISWIDSVYDELRSSRKSKFSNWIWKIRLKMVFSRLIIKGILENRKITFNQLMKLIHNRLLIISFIAGVKSFLLSKIVKRLR